MPRSPRLGGAVSLCIAVAARALLAVERPHLRGQTRADYRAVALFGLAITGRPDGTAPVA